MGISSKQNTGLNKKLVSNIFLLSDSFESFKKIFKDIKVKNLNVLILNSLSTY